MRRHVLWIVPVLVIAGVTGVSVRCLLRPELALTRSDLTMGGLLHPPAQPTAATLECTRGLVATVTEISGDWFLTQDHPPCTVGGDLLLPIEATAGEMAVVNRRPQVV